MTLLVRDEVDIVASNIDFHLNLGVDFVVATDNLSVDGTTEILRDYERRGVLHYIHQAENDYAQARWVTRMARLAAIEFGADWVINNDADEFWCPEEGDLKQALEAVPAEHDAVMVQRVNFVPRPMAKGEFFANAMTVRERQSINAFGVPLPGKLAHRGFASIEIEQGNHFARKDGRRLAVGRAPLLIRHFPVRSYRQFANKIAKGGAALQNNDDANVSTTWRQLFEIWQAGKLEAHYLRLLVDGAAVERGVAEGNLVRDDYIETALARLKQHPRIYA